MKILKSGHKKYICEYCNVEFVNKGCCIEHEEAHTIKEKKFLNKQNKWKNKMNGQTAILITGMSRSGTSCMGGVCERLGVYMGEEKDFIPADENNKVGYYEHRDLVTANKMILRLFGFDRLTITRSIAGGRPNDENIYKIINDCYEKNFKDKPLFGLKDPRLCLTYSQWIHFFNEKGIKYKVIHMYRHPDEVVDSSLKALGGHAELWYYLWKFYNLEIIKGISYNMLQDCTFIDYNDLLGDPNTNITQLAYSIYEKDIRSSKFDNGDKYKKAVLNFLDTRLRNYNYNSEYTGKFKDEGSKYVYGLLEMGPKYITLMEKIDGK